MRQEAKGRGPLVAMLEAIYPVLNPLAIAISSFS